MKTLVYLRGRFIRTDPSELTGEYAMLREDGDCFLAQFNNLEAFGRHEADWAFGWHQFTRDSFEVVFESETEVED